MTQNFYPTLDTLVQSAANQIAQWIRESVEATGKCTLCMAGGGTFRPIYEFLAEEYEEDLPWENVHIFWGDERAVSIMDPDSNVAMVFDTLLNDVAIPSSQIHIIQGARIAAEAAAIYEAELRSLLPTGKGFDIVLLGLGEDGHTASLFPQTPVLEEKEKWVAPMEKKGVRHARITLTAPFINRAERVVFVAHGAKKAHAVAAVFDDASNEFQYPAKLINPSSGNLHWFLDEKAGSSVLKRKGKS